LTLQRQVLRLEVPEAVDWHHGGRQSAGPPLQPILPRTDGGPVSAATLLLKAKQFDDRLYAAVELAAQQGAGRFAGKATLLRSLAAILTADPPGTDSAAAALVLAACELGGLSVSTPAAVQPAVRAVVEHFLRAE